MLRVADLKVVTVATSDLEAAVKAFRDNFAFPVTRTVAGKSTFLGIGAAEIEMSAASDPSGLAELALQVEDLAQAKNELAARGIAVEDGVGTDGKPLLRLGPKETHGVRLVLIGR